MKRIFKGPWLWSLLAVVGVLLALQYFAPSGEYDEITTSQMNDYIAEGEVSEITFIDGDSSRSRRPSTTASTATAAAR